jgi:hypothetical protein
MHISNFRRFTVLRIAGGLGQDLNFGDIQMVMFFVFMVRIGKSPLPLSLEPTVINQID